MEGSSKTNQTSVSVALKPSDYVHLHNHTHHSLLDGLTKIDELISRVKNLGMSAVAVTDHGTLSGAIEFYTACKNSGIKPIIGMETYVAARSHLDKDPQKDKARYHLILLAQNNQGYQNLMRLSTIASLDGFYYKPRIDHALLEKYSEGLIVLSACAGGEMGEYLRAGDFEKARQTAKWYKKVFKNRYYFEIQDHLEWNEQKIINEGLLKLSKELDIPCALTSDAHYLDADDQEAHEILLCVGTQAYLSDQDRMSLKEFRLHVTDPRDIIGRWAQDNPELITNTKSIADRCEVELELGKILIPRFPTPKAQDEKSYLDELVFQGLAWRYASYSRDEALKLSVKQAKTKLSPEVLKRAIYELNIINTMGFNGYFLIVQDFINWGKSQGIVFGPGRGSAAGSIVAYSLNITDLEPLQYDLLFERFLNPHRISMPDIDIDIQDTRRDEVINYCIEKYGKDRVANIVTFGKMAARAAVKDVARVLQVPYAESDRISKMIPPPVQGRHIPLAESLKKDPQLKREYQNNPTAKQVFDFATRLEGTIRSHGVHAAGVVIAPDDIVKFTPLEMAQKGTIATQYAMGPIEQLGLLKMDFLGLSNLTTIKNTLRIIKKVYKKDIQLSSLPMNDVATFRLFQKGDTTGVFQLESAGMKRYLRELKPNLFEDIIAMVALYRPGPMKEFPSFIKGKNNRRSVEYLHESLEPILKETYGVIVFQEQIIALLQLIAGYSAGEADLVRKAIGKKNRSIMAAEEPKFIAGCIKRGLSKVQADKLWALIQPFADYSFNKAHAACYALIAYQTAYLKANYPDAFMAALMTTDQDDTDRLAIEIAECRHMNLKVLPPDVNESFVEFGVVPEKRQIRFGMAATKGVGRACVEEILRAREEGGPFVNMQDFVSRVSLRSVNRKALESLTKAGAFDSLHNRSDILFNLDSILAYAQKIQKDRSSGQIDLFGGDSGVDMPSAEFKFMNAPMQHSERERLQWERELLGLYLSSHPLDAFDLYFSEQTIPLNSLTNEHDGKMATIGGVITTVRQIITKSGTKMAFVGLEDKTGETELIIFPSTFAEKAELLQQDTIIKAKGRINARDRDGNLNSELKIIVDTIEIISDEELSAYKSTGVSVVLPEARPINKKTQPVAAPIEDVKPMPPRHKQLFIHVKNPKDHSSLLELKRAFSRYPGDNEIVLVLGEADQKSAVKLPFTTQINADLTAHIESLYGKECVVLK